jgi:hypothetical protein
MGSPGRTGKNVLGMILGRRGTAGHLQPRARPQRTVLAPAAREHPKTGFFLFLRGMADKGFADNLACGFFNDDASSATCRIRSGYDKPIEPLIFDLCRFAPRPCFGLTGGLRNLKHDFFPSQRQAPFEYRDKLGPVNPGPLHAGNLKVSKRSARWVYNRCGRIRRLLWADLVNGCDGGF